jgi:hypothetical protein
MKVFGIVIHVLCNLVVQMKPCNQSQQQGTGLCVFMDNILLMVHRMLVLTLCTTGQPCLISKRGVEKYHQ